VEALGEASSHDSKRRVLALSGEQSERAHVIEEQLIAVLLIVVLKGLGGASQERSAARIYFYVR
jgi:hypothetical protein